MRSFPTFTYLALAAVPISGSACGDSDAESESAVDAAAGSADAAPGTPDGAPGTPDAAPGTPDAAAAEFPNGNPASNSLYFLGDCEPGYCETYDVFNTWHTAELTRCDYDGTTLSLRTGQIPDGAYAFSLSFVPTGRATSLAPETTAADWSLPDGASAFLWFSEGELVQSSGSVTFADCGSEISGTFQLDNLCEYHACQFEPWTTNVTGAFRCQPSTAIACD